MNSARAFAAVLVIAVGFGIWSTTQVSGYWTQVLAALVTVGLALAAIAALALSLDRIAGETASDRPRQRDTE